MSPMHIIQTQYISMQVVRSIYPTPRTITQTVSLYRLCRKNWFLGGWNMIFSSPRNSNVICYTCMIFLVDFVFPLTLTAGTAGFSHLCHFLHPMVWSSEKASEWGWGWFDGMFLVIVLCVCVCCLNLFASCCWNTPLEDNLPLLLETT